ncbi:MFS transporter [Haloparvum alkalitolerans]|uniref:MFS transporter n=1 Tax=Haloparvum alkalitolerans TaxID=1042953 RepID=UPI003CF8CFC4
MFRSLQTLRNSGNVALLLTVSVGWLLSLGIRIVYPVLLPDIMTEFGMRFTGGGALLSALWISYALMQFPAGILADRFGEQSVLLASLGLGGAAAVLIVAAPAFALFAVATVLLGVGTGLFGPSRVTVLSDVFPDQRNTAISFSQAAGNAGNALLPIAAGMIAVAFGWRYGFGYLLPGFLLTFVGVALFVPSRTSAAPTSESGGAYLRTLRRVVGEPPVLYATAILFCLLFYYQGITGFLPTYLLETKGLSQSAVSVVYGGFFAAAIGLQFLAGAAADRYGERRAVAGFVAAGFVGAAALPFAEGAVPVVGAVLLSASILGAIPPANTNIVLQLPDSMQGSGYGLLRSVYIGLGATAPPIIGRLGDAGALDAGVLLAAVVALGAVVGCYGQPDP